MLGRSLHAIVDYFSRAFSTSRHDPVSLHPGVHSRTQSSGTFTEPRKLQCGVFWDIENIPVKKAHAEKRVPEVKQALMYFVKNVNHFNEPIHPVKSLPRFVAVTRQTGSNVTATTADEVKDNLRANNIELIDLPYSSDADYCDDAIYQAVKSFTDQHRNPLVVALTGDVGLVRRINAIKKDFDLIVVMQRAGKRTVVMERHCDKVKDTNERDRRLAVYFMDEVIRKCGRGGVPLTFSALLRLKRARDLSIIPMEDSHLDLLFQGCDE